MDAVAISVPMHTAMRLGLEAVEIVRRYQPDVPIALYGLYAGMGGNANVDRVLIGEYEQALVDWVGELDRGAVAQSVTTDIGQLRFIRPDRSGLPALDSYAHLVTGEEHKAAGYVEASHGCRHRCAHCPIPAVYDGRYRIVQPEVVLDDINQLVAAGARHVTFGDPDFFNGAQHSMKVLRAAHATHPELTFDATIKVEHLLTKVDLLQELVANNVLFVISAFESANNEVLRLLDKGHTLADMETVIGITKDLGLDVHPTWLPFTPWTGVTDIAEIFAFLDRFDLFEVTDPVQLAIRLLIPKGSKILEIPGITQRIGTYDETALTYGWKSDDPAVDDLQQLLLERAQQAESSGEPRETTLTAMWLMALDAAGIDDVTPQIPAGALTGRPRMTEPWFC